MDNRKMISDKLKNLIEEKGVPAKELAEYVGVTQAAMSNYLNCNRSINTDTLIKICNYLNVSLEYVLSDTSENKVVLSDQEKKILKIFNNMSKEKQDAFLKLMELDK